MRWKADKSAEQLDMVAHAYNPALRRQSQEGDHESDVNLDYEVSSSQS